MQVSLNYGFPIKAFGNDTYETKRIINKLVPVNQLSFYFAEGLINNAVKIRTQPC